MNNYNESGLIFGAPGTSEWIKKEGLNDQFWMLRHVFLSLGAIDMYIARFGTDSEIETERELLIDMKVQLSEIFQTITYEYKYSEGYYNRGMTHIRDNQD